MVEINTLIRSKIGYYLFVFAALALACGAQLKWNG